MESVLKTLKLQLQKIEMVEQVSRRLNTNLPWVALIWVDKAGR